MINFLLKLMGDPNEKKVKKIMGIIEHINKLEPEFEKMTDEELVHAVNKYQVYARITPNSKLRIVEALQSQGLVFQYSWQSPAVRDIGYIC